MGGRGRGFYRAGRRRASLGAGGRGGIGEELRGGARPLKMGKALVRCQQKSSVGMCPSVWNSELTSIGGGGGLGGVWGRVEL